jgi:hypothetical protein
MRRCIAFLAVTAMLCQPARGDLIRRAFQEGIEFLTGKGSKEAGEALARRAAGAASHHTDDAARVAIRHGDDVLRLTTRYGDDAARVLARHDAVAAPLLEQLGKPAVDALGAVGPRNGRRMAMMFDAGDFQRMGRSPEVMGVIGKYGDPAMEFVWKHKGSLAVGTTLAAFLANPRPFIDGTTHLADTVAEHSVRPVAQGAGDAMRQVGTVAAWLLGGAGMVYLAKLCLKRR